MLDLAFFSLSFFLHPLGIPKANNADDDDKVIVAAVLGILVGKVSVK